MLNRFLWLFAAFALPVCGAELNLDFSEVPADKTPPNFRSLLGGAGQPGEWKIVMDEVPPLLAPLSDKAPVVTRHAVLAQTSQDPTDERFPILMYEPETFTNFKLTTRFKLVKGAAEQMAGIAFRMKDEKNYYVVRASGLGNNLRFYKVVDGLRGDIIGPSIEIPAGVWHELTIECRANQIHCQLNGKELFPTLIDNSFTSGKIGFWTKSDSVSYFTDTKITYTPHEAPAQAIVRDMMKKYPRLIDLKIYTLNEAGEPKAIGSKDATELGAAGSDVEKTSITDGKIFYGKDKKNTSVVMPLRDRNGESIAAVRFRMESFPGQTEQNAIVRAQPMMKEIQSRVQAREELTE